MVLRTPCWSQPDLPRRTPRSWPCCAPGNRRLAGCFLFLCFALGCQNGPNSGPFARGPGALGGTGANNAPPDPSVLQAQLDQLRQQQLALARTSTDLQGRAGALDRDNEDLESLVAQERQRAALLEEELTAMRDQLKSTTNQLAAAKESQREVEDRAKAMVASMKSTRPSFRPNSSLGDRIATLNIPGAEVRKDGDVIRIELPADRMFEIGGQRIRNDAAPLLEAVAGEIARNFPDQLIGIEGHTAGGSLGFQAASHELSTAQAMSVYQYLVERGRLNPKQLSVVGHGPNFPVVSNGSEAGQARNRRVEIVIYPEQAAR